METILAILMLLSVVLLYGMPTWLALARSHHNALAIGAVNLLLGWTALGWFVALIWSLTAVRH